MKVKHEAAIILAGGQSRRMGFDKAGLEIEGVRLIDLVHKKISQQCSTVLISGRQSYGLESANIPDLDNVPKGPVAAIFSVAEALQHHITGFFTLPVDGPNLPDDLCQRLYTGDHSAIAKDDNGTHPTFAWWRIEDVIMVRTMVSAEESVSLHELAGLCSACDVYWPGEKLFFNINSANDIKGYLTEDLSGNRR